MPPRFFEEIEPKTRILLARNLLSLKEQSYFSAVMVKERAYVLSLDSEEADLRVLKQYGGYAIRYYRSFVSSSPLPGSLGALKISLLELSEGDGEKREQLTAQQKQELTHLVRAKNQKVSDQELNKLLNALTPSFVRALTPERLKMAVEMYFRASEQDACQYELRRIGDWAKTNAPSLQIVLAWRNVPKYNFLFRLASLIRSHNMVLRKVVTTTVDPYRADAITLVSLGLHGKTGAAWEGGTLNAFLEELCLLKFPEKEDRIHTTFVASTLLGPHDREFLRSLVAFVHQSLVHADPNLYSYDNVEEGLTRHVDLTLEIVEAFKAKFQFPGHPIRDRQLKILDGIQKLDTGNAANDIRRKHIYRMALCFLEHLLKTNFFEPNQTAFAFRLDPKYLDHLPFNREEKFPELPYGIFFIRGLHFIAFNIRFRDLARGGVRTVIPERLEQWQIERNTIFSEAYNLAYTQQKKNKDIPEGGAKTAILLEPPEIFSKEEKIYRRELEAAGLSLPIIEEKLKIYRRDQREALLFASQRSFTEALVSIVNCEESGLLRNKNIVDYWKKPEYLYLGPDENSPNAMLEWISAYAVSVGYRPARTFMSSRPSGGINHKEFGVTSFGVNVYMAEALKAIGIDPEKEPFRIKISGGPDGDVAGNQILNLYKFYKTTARLLALTDGSGTIYDPDGLDLDEMAHLFAQGLPIRNYPVDKLHENGFLLDLKTKKEESAYAQVTLLSRKKGGKIVQEWLPGSEMNHLYRTNVHQVVTDIFIPAGGRPRTLSEASYPTYLDANGKPTSKAIVEGANLYLTPGARKALEQLGVLLIKDSSANKGGVMCSSLEVLSGLALSEEEFQKEKKEYVQEILAKIKQAALFEAHLLLATHEQKGTPLSEISDAISKQINLFKDQLLTYFETLPELPEDLMKVLYAYCPPLLRNRYRDRIDRLPSIHQKAIIAVQIASRLVYKRGLDWSPSIADILSTLSSDPCILE
jgi:glutamate dehydrogenase